ncbi:Uncharacterised protein [Vibrio cholerae]|nr:Uncharacterised protein [Vibrio cholerae]
MVKIHAALALSVTHVSSKSPLVVLGLHRTI